MKAKFAFGKTSQERLNTCHEDIQTIFAEVSKWVNASVFCGHRVESEQNKAFAEGKSQKQWPESTHNIYPSMAVDAGPYFIEILNTDWNDKIAFARFAGRVEQIADQLLTEGKVFHSIRWGGDWDMDGRSVDHKFLDLPHFELVKQKV